MLTYIVIWGGVTAGVNLHCHLGGGGVTAGVNLHCHLGGGGVTAGVNLHCHMGGGSQQVLTYIGVSGVGHSRC